MEKKIIFTPTEPSTNLLWLHYKEDSLVLESFGSNGWEPIGEFSEKELTELLSGKADLIGGKVPASQLPSYVDDVLEFVSEINITNISGTLKPEYVGKTYISTGTSVAPYKWVIINFNKNESPDDWTYEPLEEGKIYVNISNNHSYRWTGTTLFDLDQNFYDQLSVAERAISNNDISTVTDINDLGKNRADQAALGRLYNTTLDPNNAARYRQSSLSFVHNNVTYSYPIFDRDPISKTFKVYNQGSLQTYQVTLKGSIYGLVKVQDVLGYVLFNSTDAAKNLETINSLKLNESQPCIVINNGIIEIGTATRDVNNTNIVGFFRTNIRVFSVDNTTGILTLQTSQSARTLVNRESYEVAGGKKGYDDFYQTMAAQFAANTLTFDYSELNKVITDTSILEKLVKASYIIVTNIPNAPGPVVFIAGRNTTDYYYFINIVYFDSNYVTYRRIHFSKSTNILSSIFAYELRETFSSYQLAGGNKTKTVFYQDLVSYNTAIPVVIDNSILGTTITDANLINKIKAASYIIITNYPDKVAPFILTRGSESATVIRFLGLHSNENGKCTTYVVNFNVGSGFISGLGLSNLPDTYSSYVEAGGTKTRTEFNTAFVALIDAT